MTYENFKVENFTRTSDLKETTFPVYLTTGLAGGEEKSITELAFQREDDKEEEQGNAKALYHSTTNPTHLILYSLSLSCCNWLLHDCKLYTVT
ncbi:hypothetical protein SK128_005210 [Halocaridina rubra]|uniref:Uncharacterized protein n=1 Tax=Halocaridina rubra TaxID=373956 RepID=A0AAN9FTT0_HALRR